MNDVNSETTLDAVHAVDAVPQEATPDAVNDVPPETALDAAGAADDDVTDASGASADARLDAPSADVGDGTCNIVGVWRVIALAGEIDYNAFTAGGDFSEDPSLSGVLGSSPRQAGRYTFDGHALTYYYGDMGCPSGSTDVENVTFDPSCNTFTSTIVSNNCVPDSVGNTYSFTRVE